MSEIRPDQTKTHVFELKTSENTGKGFNSKEGKRVKYILTFVNGYRAEYCPLENNVKSFEMLPGMLPGMMVEFKVRYRKDFGDEIDVLKVFPLDQTHAIKAMTDAPNEFKAAANKVQNVHGHPAVVAVLTAKDIHIAKHQKGKELLLSDILADADLVYSWIVTKAGGE